MILSPSQVEDLRLATSKMTGAKRRDFQAQMCLKYCEGSTRKTERLFGWGRRNVQLGLEESGQLYLNFGSSYKTSDFIADSLSLWWNMIPQSEKQQIDLIQIKVDNGSDSEWDSDSIPQENGRFCRADSKIYSVTLFSPLSQQIQSH